MYLENFILNDTINNLTETENFDKSEIFSTLEILIDQDSQAETSEVTVTP